MNTRMRFMITRIAIVATASLAGCAQGESAPSTGALSSGSTGSTTWAAEFERVTQETQNELARSILEDQMITDLELEEVREAFRTCVAPIGITEVDFTVSGAMQTNTPEGVDPSTIQETLDRCGTETGYDAVAYLYGQVTTNPNNEDPSKVMVECLVRHGAVEPGYSAEDYNKEMTSTGGQPSFLATDEGRAAMHTCQNDPRS